MHALPKCTAMLLAVTTIPACESSSEPAPNKPSAPVVTSNSRASANVAPRPASTPSATPSPAATTVAQLRKAAADDPRIFEGEEVTLDAFFVHVAQEQFGTGEHRL
jgi:hypothetical protein